MSFWTCPQGEFGHLVLLAVFDCVDDTRLVKQAVLSVGLLGVRQLLEADWPLALRLSSRVLCLQEVLSSVDEVINNKYGKKVLLYLLSPRDPAHLLPEVVQLLEQGDGNAHR